jgi:hypothetical protein
MSPVMIGYAFEYFYFNVDTFNDNPPPRQLLVMRFFRFAQPTVLA